MSNPSPDAPFPIPPELVRAVYSFDPTYRDVFARVVEELHRGWWDDGTWPHRFEEISAAELSRAYGHHQ